jgi:two-component system nitrogen regulation response regulator GlnG
MMRVVEQIQRLQGNDLTVLITGESGTGKELVAARDSCRVAAQLGRVSALQLHHDHARAGRQPAVRSSRGSFTGAVNDQLGLVRTARAARYSSMKSATCRSTCSRSCCAFSSRARSCRIGETRPQRVDVRVLAATNADLEATRGGRQIPRRSLLPSHRHPDRDPRSAIAARRFRTSPALSCARRRNGLESRRLSHA